ncbi:hypothetical protein Rhow_004049 [Rhodococcus wratislaviensis]|uniref:Uncharacterized protein n=1 Tax=Rhodococcus wratislaviensis TaxID=44752 RepID=A0A402C9Y9_RHOWR|nr:hypothetical protein Rhow_004049 [Rhodococcus wratislaviensis]
MQGRQRRAPAAGACRGRVFVVAGMNGGPGILVRSPTAVRLVGFARSGHSLILS